MVRGRAERQSFLALGLAVLAGGCAFALVEILGLRGFWGVVAASAVLIGFGLVGAFLTVDDDDEIAIPLGGYSAADVEQMRVPPLVPRRTLVLKRMFDLLLSSIALLLLAPLALAIAITIRLTSRGPVLYTQERLGRGGRPFRALKFRTMSVEDRVYSVRDEPRIAPVGRMLQGTGLDELPRLWNVVRGDMSLVGPRALRPEEMFPLREAALASYLAPPGLVGLWSFVRTEASPADVARLDLVNLVNRSAIRDLRILWAATSGSDRSLRRQALATLWAIGARPSDASTATPPLAEPEFFGTKPHRQTSR